MKWLISLLLLSGAGTVLYAQSLGSISGKISDKQSKAALPGATVLLKESNKPVITNNEGYFKLSNLNVGKATLVISHVGYETIELDADITGGKTITVDVNLNPDTKAGYEIVVSASRRPEKITQAPASIQVINVKDLAQFAGSNVGELLAKVQGVEYTRSGVDEITFNARGLNSAFNNKVFQLVDGRNSMAALSGGLAIFNNGSIAKDDIERIEIVLGPQSALYGPNAHNGLFNYISKDPRKYPGTMVAVTAGSQTQFSSRFRHANSINNKWAFKLSGEYATGNDYEWYDTVYAGGNAGPVVNGYGPIIGIPERIHNFTFRRYRGEGHLYYSVTPKADIIVSAGGSNVNRLQVTTGGRNQLRGLLYSFIQGRLVHPRFFVNVYNTWGSLGTTYILGNYTRDYWNRTHSIITNPANPLYINFGRLPPDSAEANALRPGNTVREKSQRLNAEAQYNYNFQKAGLFLVTGLSYQKDMPNGYGVNLVDKFNHIIVTQYGAVLQLEKSIAPALRLIAATRYDHHSNFGGFLAPKFGIVKAVGDGTIRLTWGRAYAMPSILHQYGSINGFLFGNAKGIEYIPNGARFSDPASVTITRPLKPEQVNTWELGYKGRITKKIYLDINYYNGISKNFISPTQTVFGRAFTVNGIPVTHNPQFAGTVTNDDTLKGASFITYFNYGEVRTYGIDLGLNYNFSRFVNLSVKYSWFGSDITEENLKNDANNDLVVTREERSLNAPANRAAATLNFQNLCKEKFFLSIGARYVQEYDFYSANQIGTRAGKGRRGKIERPPYPPLLKNFDWGPLGNFITVDMNAGYQFNTRLSLNVGITNLFNTRQIEFVGSPSIGRLIAVELKVQLPNESKQ